MAKKKKKKKFKSMYFEALHSIRKDWGEFNPVTRIMPDKTKYNRNREKNKNKNNDVIEE